VVIYLLALNRSPSYPTLPFSVGLSGFAAGPMVHLFRSRASGLKDPRGNVPPPLPLVQLYKAEAPRDASLSDRVKTERERERNGVSGDPLAMRSRVCVPSENLEYRQVQFEKVVEKVDRRSGDAAQLAWQRVFGYTRVASFARRLSCDCRGRVAIRTGR